MYVIFKGITYRNMKNKRFLFFLFSQHLIKNQELN